MSIKQVLESNKTLLYPTPASTALNRGDLVWSDPAASNVIKQASARTDLTATALNQIDFAQRFAGVLQDQRLSTETLSGDNALRVVVTDGVFDCACPSLTWNVGDLVGIDRDGTNNVNFNQQVNKVTLKALAIGVCVQRQASAVTVVRARLIASVGAALGNPGIGDGQGRGVTTLADAAATLTVASNAMLNMVPTAARNVTLPAEAQSAGLKFYFTNNSGGAFSVTFKASDGATAIKGNGVVPQNKTGVFWCDGTSWNGMVSA